MKPRGGLRNNVASYLAIEAKEGIGAARKQTRGYRRVSLKPIQAQYGSTRSSNFVY